MATLRQKKAVEALVETRGVVSAAMIKAGYDETTAKNPKNLTDSDGWKELMEKHLDDKKLAKKHEKLLDDPSSKIQLGALGLAYKVKGYVESEKDNGSDNKPIYNLFFNPDIRLAVKNLDEQIKKALYGNPTQTILPPVESDKEIIQS